MHGEGHCFTVEHECLHMGHIMDLNGLTKHACHHIAKPTLCLHIANLHAKATTKSCCCRFRSSITFMTDKEQRQRHHIAMVSWVGSSLQFENKETIVAVMEALGVVPLMALERLMEEEDHLHRMLSKGTKEDCFSLALGVEAELNNFKLLKGWKNLAAAAMPSFPSRHSNGTAWMTAFKGRLRPADLKAPKIF